MQVDWARLGNPKIPVWLQEAASIDATVREKALNNLKNAIAPWELLDGYGSYIHLIKIAESPIPETVVPFLLDLLRNPNVKNPSYILETLHDISRYEYVNEDFIPMDKRESYHAWAQRLRQLIRNDWNFFQTLLNHDSADVRNETQTLIDLLSRSDRSDG